MSDDTAHLVVVSDTHINSTVALCPPSINLDDGGTYRASRTQRWLWDCWLDFWEQVGKLKGRKILCVNGDLGELDVKRRNYQLITPNKATIQNIILDTLLPGLEVVSNVIIIRGTMAHIGKSSWLEEAIANDLDNTIHDNGTASWWHCRPTINYVRFDIAHHATMGNLPWTEKNAGNKIAKIIIDRYHEMDADLPHVAIRSHNHRYSDSGGNFRTFAFCTRSWSSMTEYVYRIGKENDLAEIGGHVVTCSNGEWRKQDYPYTPKGVRRVWQLKI